MELFIGLRRLFSSLHFMLVKLIARRHHNNLKKLVIVQVNEKKPRDHSPPRWVDAVKNLTGMTFLQAIKTAVDRALGGGS